MFKTLRHQESMIISSCKYWNPYLQGPLQRVLKVVQVSKLKWIPHNRGMVGPPLQCSSPREKKKKGENSHNSCMCTLSCGRSLFIYRHWVYKIFTKTHIVMFISTNIHESNSVTDKNMKCSYNHPFIALI